MPSRTQKAVRVLEEDMQRLRVIKTETGLTYTQLIARAVKALTAEMRAEGGILYKSRHINSPPEGENGHPSQRGTSESRSKAGRAQKKTTPARRTGSKTIETAGKGG